MSQKSIHFNVQLFRTIIHYAQEVNSKTFQAYDHGDDNEAIYGQPDPPLYVPEAITLPVATYWSLNDWLADPSVIYFHK
jgi:lysosomal acid lipase/cholesteryl ester hydrolase